MLNVKVERRLLNEIDRNLSKHRYTTRSEFVREAVRDKLSELEKKELLEHVKHVRGIFKHKTTDEQLHKIREKMSKKMEKKEFWDEMKELDKRWRKDMGYTK